MPILFGFAGLLLIVAGVRNRITAGNPSLISLLEQDMTGSDPYWKWMLAIFLIGAIGYIPDLKPISRGFLVLVIIVFLLSNQGVFAKLSGILEPFTQNENATLGTYSPSTFNSQIQNNANSVTTNEGDNSAFSIPSFTSLVGE